MSEEDSDDEEYLQTADLDDQVGSEEPVPDSLKCLSIHGIPMLATPYPQANQGVPATPPPQPNQIEIPLDHEPMELYIPEDIPDLIDVPEEVISDFDAWVQNVLVYPW